MYERTLSGVLGPYFAQIKQIGTGGNGRVLSAIDTRFDFPVCIKRISVANKDECRATLREIRIRRRLRHENIVGLLNAIVPDGTDVSEITPANFRDTTCIYLVQELLDADLRQVIESYTRLSDEYVQLFFYQMLRGLKYIHSANVLHRDLKPSNIMININSLQLMIGDFGHSTVLDPDYTHGNSLAVCSTSLWYKAPELILGTAQYSTSSDIWAVGCILAEMLLGRPLFEGENELEQLEMIIHAIRVDEKDQFYVRRYLTETANSMYSGKPKFPLQSKFQKVDFHALHLLEHLLSFNADDRVTTELALSHPFLHKYACTADEPVCLKPLHLEHEVDDFLEYTLKDLIVGECVALAEEQPRIHLQMSSYSSLTDIAKDCNNSPCESSSQSMDDGRLGVELKIVSEDYDELSNESEGSRFKVLEVLKEEHGSSSDSNGLAAHEEGVSEAPLVLDHPMFSSSRWENERYRSSGHRRHHSHHRRKQSDESKSRRRKLSRDEKSHLKSPCSDPEPTLDSTQATGESLPQIHLLGDETTGMNVARFCNPGDELSAILPPDVEVHLASNSESTIAMEGQDDKVQELIMRSRQLIADQTAIMNDVPAITDICSSSKPSVEVFMETADEKAKNSKLEKSFISSSVDDLSMLNHRKRVVDLEVADVIKRSQELLGELPTASAPKEKSVVANERDSVQDLISRSEQLLKSTRVPRSTTPEHKPCATEERRALTNDTGDDLNSKSEELCMSHEITERIRNLNTARNGEANVEQFSLEFTLEDNSFDHPPPFTDNSSDLTTELPPASHLQTFDPCTIVHSSVEDNVYPPWTTPFNHPQPISDTTTNSLQPMLSDPYHLKESSRRMQVLLEESHSLIKRLKADQIFCSEFEPGPHEDQFRKVPVHGGDFENNEELVERKTIKAETFRERLDVINLEEMKLVLDEAKKLLTKSNNLDASNVEESPDVEQCLNDMEIENATDGEDCVEKFTTMEIDENVRGGECGNVKSTAIEHNFNSCKISDFDKNGATVDLEVIREDCESHDLKDLLCLQNQLDFVHVVTDPTATSEQAAISEVVKIKRSPPLEKQTSRLNCLARSRGSSIIKSMEESDEFGERISQVNGGVDGSPFQHDKEVFVKKRSNDALSEAIDDSSHKHFKNSGLTLLDVTTSCEEVGKTVEENIHQEIGVLRNRTDRKEYDSKQLRSNGIRTTLDLNVDKRLIDSNFKANVVISKNCQNENVGKAKKLLPKCESVDKDNYSNRVIEEINSDDVVEKLYGTTCRMENNTKRMNSKDSARLQNFYAALKIKSIMRNRARPHREKRHDTYPF